MGTKHPDQIAPTHWRGAAETVGAMYERRWELTARCRACELVTLVDLRVVIRMKGPGFSLWNRHTRCRRVLYRGRCPGVVDFSFKAPGMTAAKILAASDRTDAGPVGHVARAFAEERARQVRAIEAGRETGS